MERRCSSHGNGPLGRVPFSEGLTYFGQHFIKPGGPQAIWRGTKLTNTVSHGEGQPGVGWRGVYPGGT